MFNSCNLNSKLFMCLNIVNIFSGSGDQWSIIDSFLSGVNITWKNRKVILSIGKLSMQFMKCISSNANCSSSITTGPVIIEFCSVRYVRLPKLRSVFNNRLGFVELSFIFTFSNVIGNGSKYLFGNKVIEIAVNFLNFDIFSRNLLVDIFFTSIWHKLGATCSNWLYNRSLNSSFFNFNIFNSVFPIPFWNITSIINWCARMNDNLSTLFKYLQMCDIIFSSTMLRNGSSYALFCFIKRDSFRDMGKEMEKKKENQSIHAVKKLTLSFFYICDKRI